MLNIAHPGDLYLRPGPIDAGIRAQLRNMTGPSDIEPPEVILQTLGAIEIGVLLASVLYGVMCVQAYNYAMHTISDQSWIRYMVGFVV
jgi:hypothetical protein